MLPLLPPEHYNAEWTLIGPTSPFSSAPQGRALSWLSNHRLEHYGPDKLSGVGVPSTGQVNGSFTDSVTLEKISFTGVALQKQNMAGGLFVRNNASGAMRILGGTTFPYPGSEDPGAQVRVLDPGAPVSSADSPSRDVAKAAGTYAGVIELGGATRGAIEGVKLTSTGGVSGTIWLNGVRRGFRGSLGNPIDAGGGVILNLELTLTAGTEDGFGLSGQVAGGYSVDAQRRTAFTKQSPAPQSGAPYTMVIRAPGSPDVAPGGDGYGTLSVSALGLCTGSLTLADGTAVTLAGAVGRSNGSLAEWSFYRAIYGANPGGYLAGKITFRDEIGISDLDGDWQWVKRPSSPSFNVTRKVVGSRYNVPLTGERALSLASDGDQNIWLRWSGVDLSSLPNLAITQLNRTGTWSRANRLVFYGPEKVTLSFNPRSGLLTGTCIDLARGINCRFGGVILQKQNRFGGSYRVGSQSGLFTIEERTPLP